MGKLQVVEAYLGPNGQLYRTPADACAALLVEIVGSNLQHAEAVIIVKKRGEIIRLLQLMDISAEPERFAENSPN